MKRCLLLHSWSSWERQYDCRYKRYCRVDQCNAEQTKYEHKWGSWFYETPGSCRLLRKCLRCGEIDQGSYHHEWTEWEYKSAKNCRLIRRCLRCDFENEGDAFHKWSNWSYKCHFKCEAIRICSRCGEAESELAHSWGDWKYKSKDDCGQLRICERCKSEEIGWEKHEWKKVRFYKWVCERCNDKKTLKNYIHPAKWRSKIIQRINPDSPKMINHESRRLEIIEDIVKGKELERRSEKERIKKYQSISASYKRSMGFLRENLLLDSLIIDSNIWMDDRPQYDNFITIFRFLLMHLDIRYTFYGPQFEEICNIKFRTVYGESANKKSRIAINRIDKLSDENLLRITPVNIELEYPGHVDPMLIKLLLMDAKKGKNVALLSNDVELRIRAREKLKEFNVSYYRILKMDDIEKHIEIIKLAMEESITDNVQHRAENVIYL